MTIPELVPVIREALEDAIEYRQLTESCGDCTADHNSHVGTARVLCATCEADFQRVRRYMAALEHFPEVVSA